MATLNRADDTIDVPDSLPVLALRDLVFFPYMVLPLLIGRPASVAALDEAEAEDGLLLLVAQRDAEVEDPTQFDVFTVGTVVRLIQITRLTDGTARVVMEGLGRARISEFLPPTDGFRALVSPYAWTEADAASTDSPVEAQSRRLERLYEEYIRLNHKLPEELYGTIAGTSDRQRMAHLMAGHLLVSAEEKQEILEAEDLAGQLDLLTRCVSRELEILRIEEKIDDQIRRQIDSDRRELYLQEQLKAIHKELGSGEGDWADLEQAVEEAVLPSDVRDRARRELERLRRLNPVAPEAAVIRTYLDWVVALPWAQKTSDNLDVTHAGRILDAAHYGLGEVKERILDHIAVLSLVGELQGPILCLVGPPGVGKTSLGRSIARALGREFVRVSLGGIRDEAEIRGHRRTYVGALPGRIIQGIRKGGSRNPVFLLDEVDKLAADFHGDPAAALLEVLDPEQNQGFADHYLEVEFDLSDVFFIATANTLAGIPEPLRDRMEVIRLPGYLDTEKREIANRFLWPKQVSRHGLGEAEVTLSAEALERVIDEYTREAGVRELEQRISRLARKVARKVASGEIGRPARVELGHGDLRELLGPPPYPPQEREEQADRTGIVFAMPVRPI